MSSEATNTTACYIRADGKTLMLRRAKMDAMHGKWIPPGGKFEPGETPEECVVREVYEETGLTLTESRLRGILTFVRYADAQPVRTTTCFVFESFAFTGDARSSTEGDVCWVPDEELPALDLPASDHIFLPWIYEDTRFFSAKFSNGLRSVTFHAYGDTRYG